MKAFVYRTYGSPDVLTLEEIEKPVPKEDELLIKVRAASVNPYDWHFLRGTPYFLRLMAGLRKPKEIRLGADLAGVVESVGSKVTQFKPGDEVFGMAKGAFAEYACAVEAAVCLKPAKVTFEQAASLPIAGLTALQGLRDKCQIQAGQKLLVNGAAGGVGTFVVQIAKWFGAEVTGVCSARNVELVRSIGADHVIDYAQEDFTRSAHRYDLIYDTVGNQSLSACRRVLAPTGVYVGIGGGGPDVHWMIGPIAGMLATALLAPFRSQKVLGLIAKRSREDLKILADLVQKCAIAPVIDRSYPLSELPAAIRYLEQGHARGKILIAPQESNG